MNQRRSPKYGTARKFTKLALSKSPSVTTNSLHGSSDISGKRFACTCSTLNTFLPYYSLVHNKTTRITALVFTFTLVSIVAYSQWEVFTKWYTLDGTIWTFVYNRWQQDESEYSDWNMPEAKILQEYGSNICTIERVSASDLTPEIFDAEFRYKKPILVTFLNGARDWTEPNKWSRRELSKAYSKLTIHSGQSLDIVRTGGNARHASSLHHFLTSLMIEQKNGTHEPTYYAFDRNFYRDSDLPRTLRLPKYFQVNDSEDESVFFLGTSLTGVVFHKHSDTWNGVVHGQKRWFLYPNSKTPPGGVHHGFSLLEWVDNVYPNLADVDKPIECVQQPGEILYLPEGTYHATLNLGDTIAVAIQKKNAATEAEELSYEATKLVNYLQEKPEKNQRASYYARLLEIYKRWLELLPESSEAVMKTGEVLHDMGDYSGSVPWHVRAIRMDPYFVLAYIHLAKTFSALREYEKAEMTFRKAIDMSPNLWDNYKEYGEFLLKQGRHRDALPIFKKGTELMPDLIPFWSYYKQCQIQTGDQKGAESSAKIIADLKARRELDNN